MATLLIDMDSVLCDLMGEWHRRYNEDYDDDLDYTRLVTWNSEDFVKEACGPKIYDYLDQPGLFRDLTPLPDAIAVMKRLAFIHNIFIVTTSRPSAFQDKIHWVDTHLPEIGEKRMIFTHHKDQICGDVLFDDAPHNLLAFKKSGRMAVAMSYPYNKDIDVPHVDSWLAFERYINEHWSDPCDK